MRAIFTTNCGSRLAFQVLVACQLIPASCRTWRTVSALMTIRCALVRCSTSLVRLHVVNGSPTCWGAVLATRQTISRATDPNLRGRPPLHFGSNAANPWVLNAWITSRAYCAVAANIPAASAGLRPCIEASTIPARRSRTRVSRRPGDLDQALRLGRVQLADKHLRLSSHHHLHRQPPGPPDGGSTRHDYNANLPGRSTSSLISRFTPSGTATNKRSGGKNGPSPEPPPTTTGLRRRSIERGPTPPSGMPPWPASPT